jgi:hypothetical protein
MVSAMTETEYRPPLWEIYMLSGERWRCVGTCSTRAIAEMQAQAMRRCCPGIQFAVLFKTPDAEEAA